MFLFGGAEASLLEAALVGALELLLIGGVGVGGPLLRVADKGAEAEALGVEDLGLGHRLAVEEVAGLEGRVRLVGVELGEVVADGAVVHAAVGAPAAVVGLDAQVDAQVHLEVGLGGADLAALGADPFGLVEVDGAHVVVEVGEVGEDFVAVLADGDVLLFVGCLRNK